MTRYLALLEPLPLSPIKAVMLVREMIASPVHWLVQDLYLNLSGLCQYVLDRRFGWVLELYQMRRRVSEKDSNMRNTSDDF